MKIIVTGSLGHISQPLTKVLIEKVDKVTVISSNADKKPAIEALGAIPAIGSIHDVDFLKKAFTGADALYTMVPPPANFFDPGIDMEALYSKVIGNYTEAIEHAGIQRVVHLRRLN